MLNVTTARAAAKETKFEYEQCYVVDVELCESRKPTWISECNILTR